ncbi:MAG: inositol monophosphatase [Alphaproteobacteria bacterium]|nr:inositol monophosphatase [Alphaproteobacteria bacterium]
MSADSAAALDARERAIVAVVREAGALAMVHFKRRDPASVSLKGAQDWLTVADGAVESFIRREMTSQFGDAVFGEEEGGDDGERVWVIDPIDGTANFARCDLLWCISVAFVGQGVPEIGVVFAPAIDEFYIGRRGRGAHLNGTALRVAPTDDIRRSVVEIGWSPRRTIDAYLDLVGRAMRAGASVKRSASGALGMTQVAAGRTDAYVEIHINSWDVMAGLVIAREAGAATNDFCSGDWLRQGNPILCAAPGIAGRLSDVLGMPLRHD